MGGSWWEGKPEWKGVASLLSAAAEDELVPGDARHVLQ